MKWAAVPWVALCNYSSVPSSDNHCFFSLSATMQGNHSVVKTINLFCSDNNTLYAVCPGTFNCIHTNQVSDTVITLAVVYIYHRAE